MSLEYIETSLAENPTSVVIWLHGLGADGHDFEGIVPELQLPAKANMRFIFPHAPYRPISLNNGYVMRGWYDVASLAFDDTQDELGINESAELLIELIEQQVAKGIAAERIILAGFSQGGAIVLHTGLRYGKSLGGIMALSTYLPLADRLQAEMHPANHAIPLFMAHGLQDEIVKYQYGAQSRTTLVQAGYQPEWHDYTMGHSVCGEEMADIRRWLMARLS